MYWFSSDREFSWLRLLERFERLERLDLNPFGPPMIKPDGTVNIHHRLALISPRVFKVDSRE